MQCFRWLWGAVRGDLGTSWASGQPAFKHILEALPVTLEIALLTIVMSVVIAIPAGVISAVKQNTWVDHTARFFTVIGLSVPNFVVATALLLVPAMAGGGRRPSVTSHPGKT